MEEKYKDLIERLTAEIYEGAVNSILPISFVNGQP